MTKYIGWVPTVGGRLSYSVIGHSSHPTIAEIANVADDKKRRILCLQKRTLLDSALPIFKDFILENIWGLSGTFYFFMDAESSNDLSTTDQRLRDKIYLFTEKQSQFYFFDRISQKIYDIKNAINKLNEQGDPIDVPSVDSCYKEVNSEFLYDIEENCNCSAEFELDRDGIIEVDYSFEESKSLEHLICAQLFFFIKDISHKHQHHHPKTDTILDIYNKSNHNWQDEALRSLYKRVLDFKRSRNELVCSSALGVLSYIKSFKSVCKNKNFALSAIRDDSNLSESIKISQDELRYATAQRVGFKNTLIATLLAMLGVFLMLSSLVPLVKPDIKIESDAFAIKLVANEIINQPLRTLVFVLIVSLCYSTYTYWEYKIGSLTWFKNMTRIMQTIKSQVTSGVVMLSFSFLAGFCAYVLFQYL